MGERVVGEIGTGFLVLVGFRAGDTAPDVEWMADRIAGLRLFADGDGRLNLALGDVQGAVLVVSQFTLYGDARRGRRPSFVGAARPEIAIPLYERFLTSFLSRGIPTQSGTFGADMQVKLVNDGPVTLILDRGA